MSEPRRWETISIDTKIADYIDVDSLPRVMVVAASAYDAVKADRDRLRTALEVIARSWARDHECAAQGYARKALEKSKEASK